MPYSIYRLAGECSGVPLFQQTSYNRRVRGFTKLLLIIGITLGLYSVAMAWQMPWREYPGQDNIAIPPDYQQKTEWAFARLMYPPYTGSINGRGSVEQPVDLDDGDDVFNYPWLYAVEVGHWQLTDSQVKQMRDFLERGGFFMCDDFHGTQEWEVFIESMQRVFPDRPIVDIPDKDAIFHTIYDLDGRYQVPGAQYLRSGRTYEQDGYNATWRGIYDNKGRLMVAICHNMDLGDAWEYADDPRYDEKFAALAFRIVSNYVVYSMTH